MLAEPFPVMAKFENIRFKIENQFFNKLYFKVAVGASVTSVAVALVLSVTFETSETGSVTSVGAEVVTTSSAETHTSAANATKTESLNCELINSVT